ncbi:MAG: hypothetical protein Q3W86_07460 [Evtepia sp.]|jgi:hypothetical protein|nr:hypothetical protein [Evtepia sp.]
MRILAIDPGDKQSAYCFIDSEGLRPLRFAKAENAEVLLVLQLEKYDLVVIERLASYGMPVGRNVFETCEWVGRFTQAAQKPVDYIYRQDEKLYLCHDSRAKDANIRRALIDRFATHDLKNGKGTKKNPDWFYGFSADVWAAYAVGITYTETKLKL